MSLLPVGRIDLSPLPEGHNNPVFAINQSGRSDWLKSRYAAPALSWRAACYSCVWSGGWSCPEAGSSAIE